MATLSGQTIQDTYDGLLKLEDSTNPISSSLQNIQDGLGNNTGFRIAQNQLFHRQLTFTDNYKPDYGGVGWSDAANTNWHTYTNMQNRMVFEIVYDPGLYTYSSITYNLITATTTSDVFEVAFYDTQFINGFGLAPRNLIMSGITLNTTPIGITEIALPSNLTFSGGSQYYIIGYKISNSGVTPTFRVRSSEASPYQSSIANNQIGNASFMGMTIITVAGITPQSCWPIGLIASIQNKTFTLGFQTSYSSSDILDNIQSTPSIVTAFGYILKTI